MISVIMPTLWRGEYYKRMFPIFNNHPLIGEIIVIDNAPNKTDQEIFKLEKVRYFAQTKNLYVNPSWNLGVELSNFNILCLYSDDVYFDSKCIEEVHKVCTPQGGIAGFSLETISESHDNLDYLSPHEVLQVIPSNAMHYRFGMCMFLHKESYFVIPEELKINYGDAYLFDQNVMRGKSNFKIEGCATITRMRTSSKAKEFDDVRRSDAIEYAKINPSEGLIMELMDNLEKNI